MWHHEWLGMGNGRSSPEGGWWEAFPQAQTKQAENEGLSVLGNGRPTAVSSGEFQGLSDTGMAG